MGREHPANGVNKCANCGSSDIRFDGAWLTCAHCRHRWNTTVLADELRLSEGIENLVGTSVLTGAKDIDTSSLVTVTCGGCGASFTINSETSLEATCHWCRHVLSLNNPVDNGAVPDAILPFYVTREDAMNRMAAYVRELAPNASPEFRTDFARFPIRAVYLPYLVVDGNVTVRLDGEGWIAKGMAKESPYPQDCIYETGEFAVMRAAEISVDDLVIEARSTHTPLNAAVSTTNIINAIQPFDVEQAVRFDARYLTDGVAFEKRDVEVSGATAYAGEHFATIARNYVNPTLSRYTGGVRWETEQVAIKGSRWVSMLLPVWLYAFEEHTPNGPMMHYIAVNGRTGETEGSVPGDVERAAVRAKNWRRTTIAVLAAPLALVVLVACIAAIAGAIDGGVFAMVAGIPLLLMGWVFAVGKANGELHRNDAIDGLRNPHARLKPETETKFTPRQVRSEDRSMGDFTHHGGPEILDRNDHEPHVRAGTFTVDAGDSRIAPQASPEAIAAVSSHVREKKFNGSGRRVDGQFSSAPPPREREVPTWDLNPH